MQQAAEVDLDRLVDYKTEYCSVIKKHKITGDNLTGLCPFHDDRANSFSVDLKTGMWHCFAEDEGGNFVTFYAKLNNERSGDSPDSHTCRLDKLYQDNGKHVSHRVITSTFQFQHGAEVMFQIHFL